MALFGKKEQRALVPVPEMYAIVSKPIDLLAQAVNEFIAAGWVPQGGPVKVPFEGEISFETYYAQALVRRELLAPERTPDRLS